MLQGRGQSVAVAASAKAAGPSAVKTFRTAVKSVAKVTCWILV